MAARLSAPTSAFDLGQNSEINVTPFVDVMLVLLIIFMVVAAAATSAVKVDLPGTPENAKLPRTPITVSVAADGGVYVNDKRASLDEVAGVVTGLIADGRHDDRVVVRADRTIDYDVFMQVMSRLNRGGVSKLALMSEVN